MDNSELNASKFDPKGKSPSQSVTFLGLLKFRSAESIELSFALLAGLFLLIGWISSFLGYVPAWFSIVSYAVAYFFGGYFALLDAIAELRVPRFRIDFLMIVAAVGAAVLNRWGEGALLLFLFSLGHGLERYAMGRAKRAIEALAELTPKTVTVKRNGSMDQIPVDQLQISDTVVVKPNERIAADGFVVSGYSSVNQAPITGESMPVDKWEVANREEMAVKFQQQDQIPAEHQVFAGTINGTGLLEIYATCLAEDTTLARVVKLVKEANSQKSPSQHFADNFERYFVPLVLIFVTLLLFVFVVTDEKFSDSFYRAMAVLIGASPCALAISTPSAILSGVARGAQVGVLIKGGNPLEGLGQLESVAFDKTGTLTSGAPYVTDVLPWKQTSEIELLQTAIAVERLSDHPLAAAVVRDGQQRLAEFFRPSSAVSATVDDRQQHISTPNELSHPVLGDYEIQSITGRGVTARIGNDLVSIGRDRLFTENGSSIPAELNLHLQKLRSAGRTTMVVQRNGDFLGVIGLMDTPRPQAARTIQQLKGMGIKRMIILSGDSQQVVDAVGREVGIEEGRGDLMPGDKVELVKELAKSGPVAMVGDGVNDAPALARATVGVAMGAAGSAVALETADVALMSDDLEKLSFAIGLGRRTSRIIRQNLWISLGTVVILVPLCLLGLQIGWAVVFHEGSTVAVVCNALRLLGFRRNGVNKREWGEANIRVSEETKELWQANDGKRISKG